MHITIEFLKEHPEYVAAAGLWSYQAWSSYDASMTRKNQIEKYQQYCNIDHLPLCIIAFNSNHELMGMCTLIENEGLDTDYIPWLSSLYVTPSFRNHRVGEALIEKSKEIARKMGYSSLYLFAIEATLTCYFAKLGWSLYNKKRLSHPANALMSIALTKKER